MQYTVTVTSRELPWAKRAVGDTRASHPVGVGPLSCMCIDSLFTGLVASALTPPPTTVSPAKQSTSTIKGWFVFGRRTDPVSARGVITPGIVAPVGPVG